MIEQIVNKLASRPTNNISVNNFYRGNDKETQNRLNNIARYLAYYENNPPKFILIGEAPGHKGCAQSGIPLTSPYVINNVEFFRNNIQITSGDGKENTSTIIWELFGSLKKPPLLWNAFPFHPHNNNLHKSNRKPNKAELEEGLEYIKILQGIFPNSELVAVGKVAYESLSFLGLEVEKVRHPSFGGKKQFNEQMSELLK